MQNFTGTYCGPDLGIKQPEVDRPAIPAETPPRISIIVACRNEGHHIRSLVTSILAQDLQCSWEAIFADGSSEDGTNEILQELCHLHPQFRLIENPERIASAGLNRTIEAARGTYIIRMDAHTRYRSDYCTESIKALEQTGAENVGGPARTEASGMLGLAIAGAFHSRFSTGGAKFHDENHEGWVDTVPYGCWRKTTLQRIGLFDASLVRNQDDELNLRLRRCGGKIWQSRNIVSWYSPRASLSSLFQQYLQYGFWKVAVVRKHRIPGSWRQLVPVVFVLANCFLALAVTVSAFMEDGPTFWLMAWLVLILGYASINLAASIATARCYGWGTLLYLPVVFAAFHVAYGLGFLAGMLSGGRTGATVSHPSQWFTRVTR